MLVLVVVFVLVEVNVLLEVLVMDEMCDVVKVFVLVDECWLLVGGCQYGGSK